MASLKKWTTREVKAVTIRETECIYGAMDCPSAICAFWRDEVVRSAWFDPGREALVVGCLDAKLKMRVFSLVTLGIANQTLIHAREVFRPAIITASSSVVLMHNHPSGNPTPSDADIRATRDIKQAGDIMGIPLLDHVIIGKPSEEHPHGYVSIKELGLLSF